MDSTRRTLLQTLPLGFGAFALGSSAWAAANQTIQSFAIPFDQLPAHKNGANVSRPIVTGIAHDGSHLEVHETTLAPGLSPHPPHHHVHEELLLLSQGTIETTIAGKTTTLGPGSAAFFHPEMSMAYAIPVQSRRSILSLQLDNRVRATHNGR